LGAKRPAGASLADALFAKVQQRVLGVLFGNPRRSNRGEYEGDADVDECLLADLVAACTRVAAALRALPPVSP
jgi:hypothetical protein